jgi:hypothetical protein
VRFVKQEAGSRFQALELNVLVNFVAVGGDTDGRVSAVADSLGVEPELVRTSPLTLIGSVAEVVEKLVGIRERLGISYFVVSDSAVDDMAPVVAKLAGT